MLEKKISHLSIPQLYNPLFFSPRGEPHGAEAEDFFADSDLFYWREWLRASAPEWMDITVYLVIAKAFKFLDAERAAGNSLIQGLEALPSHFLRPQYPTTTLQKFLWQALIDEIPVYLYSNARQEQFRSFTPLLKYDCYGGTFYFDQGEKRSRLHARSMLNAWQTAVSLYLRGRAGEIAKILQRARDSFTPLITDRWLISQLMARQSKNEMDVHMASGELLAEYDRFKKAYLLKDQHSSYYLPAEPGDDQPYLILACLAERHACHASGPLNGLTPAMPDYYALIAEAAPWVRPLLVISENDSLPAVIGQGDFNLEYDGWQVQMNVTSLDRTWHCLISVQQEQGGAVRQARLSAEVDSQRLYYKRAQLKLERQAGEAEAITELPMGSIVSLILYVSHFLIPRPETV